MKSFVIDSQSYLGFESMLGELSRPKWAVDLQFDLHHVFQEARFVWMHARTIFGGVLFHLKFIDNQLILMNATY